MSGTFWRLLLCAVAVLGATAQSKANSLPVFDAIADLGVCFASDPAPGCGITINSVGNLSGTNTWTFGSTSATISLNQSLTATAQTGQGQTGIMATSAVDLFYYVEVVSPSQATTPVPVTVQASGSVSPGYSQENAVVFELASLIDVLCSPSCTGGAEDSFALNTTVDLVPNVAYSVRLEANAEAYNGSSASATLDPFFQFASGFNSAGYSLQFSDGITNTPPAVTPIPLTLPLFTTGLGALALLGWRRKRKAQAAAA